MSKKKARKNSEQGIYALCVTCGFIVGLGLGPMIGSVLISMLIGLGLGTLAGYLINRQNRRRKS